MKRTIKKIADRLLAGDQEYRRWTQCGRLQSYLEQVGWFRSVDEGLPVDRDGNCLPWFTFSAISFLKGRINSKFSVFEYGSGNSTLWWSKRVARVVSYEHDAKWFETLRSIVPANVEYFHVPLEYGGDYSKAIRDYHNAFDVVVIDGRDRVQCARNAIGALKKWGVFIWDNSDRSTYEEGYQFLRDQGFKRLDFEGLGPINDYQWSTSVFYRDENCLEI